MGKGQEAFCCHKASNNREITDTLISWIICNFAGEMSDCVAVQCSPLRPQRRFRSKAEQELREAPLNSAKRLSTAPQARFRSKAEKEL